MTTFDKHLLRRYLYVFCILFLSTFGLFVVIDGFTNVDGFQQDKTDAKAVLARMADYYLYRSSIFFDMAGPILSVISVMVVFALLQRHNEIHPILAAGIPTYRLLVPFLVGMILVNIGLIVNQELVIPRISHHLQAPRSSDETSSHKVVPVYDYATHILIAGKELFLGTGRIRQAKFVLPAPEIARKLTTLKAREATFYKASANRPAGWLLHDVIHPLDNESLTPHGEKIVKSLKNPNDLFIRTDVSPDQLYNRNQSYKYVSTRQLIRRIKNPSYDFRSVRDQSLHVHARLMRPFINMIAVLVAVPLIVRKESGGLAANLAICAGVLGLVFGVTQMFLYLGKVNLIAPDLATWVPLILSGTLSAWLSGIMQT